MLKRYTVNENLDKYADCIAKPLDFFIKMISLDTITKVMKDSSLYLGLIVFILKRELMRKSSLHDERYLYFERISFKLKHLVEVISPTSAFETLFTLLPLIASYTMNNDQRIKIIHNIRVNTANYVNTTM